MNLSVRVLDAMIQALDRIEESSVIYQQGVTCDSLYDATEDMYDLSVLTEIVHTRDCFKVLKNVDLRIDQTSFYQKKIPTNYTSLMIRRTYIPKDEDEDEDEDERKRNKKKKKTDDKDKAEDKKKSFEMSLPLRLIPIFSMACKHLQQLLHLRKQEENKNEKK